MPDTAAKNAAQQAERGGPAVGETKGDAAPGAPTAAPRPETGAGPKGTGRRYVVRHTMVGPHDRGTVAAESQFPPGTDFDRLVELGAVREAAEDEQNLARVTIPDENVPHQTYEHMVAEKDRQIQMHQAEKAVLETRLAARRAEESNRAATADAASAATLFQEKDRRVTELERENAQLKAENVQLKAAAGKAADKSK